MAESYTMNNLLTAYTINSSIPITVDATTKNYLNQQTSKREKYEEAVKADDTKLDSITSNIEAAKERMNKLSKNVKKARGTLRKAAWEKFNANLKDLKAAKEKYKSAKHNLKDRISYAKQQGVKIGNFKISQKETELKRAEDVQKKDQAEMHEKNTINLINKQLSQVNLITAVKERLTGVNISSLPENVRLLAQQFLATVENKGIEINIQESLENSKIAQLANTIRNNLNSKEKNTLDKSTKKIGSSFQNKAIEYAENGIETKLDLLTSGKDDKDDDGR